MYSSASETCAAHFLTFMHCLFEPGTTNGSADKRSADRTLNTKEPEARVSIKYIEGWAHSEDELRESDEQWKRMQSRERCARSHRKGDFFKAELFREVEGVKLKTKSVAKGYLMALPPIGCMVCLYTKQTPSRRSDESTSDLHLPSCISHSKFSKLANVSPRLSPHSAIGHCTE